MALLTCGCGQTIRIPSIPKGRIRCPACKHILTPAELVEARPEPPSPPKFRLDDDPTHACKDDETCGWEGTADELDEGRCPECGKRVRKLEE